MSEHEGEPELLVEKQSAGFMVPQALLDEYAGLNDFIGKALRGEIELKPVPEQWHRCFWCWLVAKLPGHDRCRHGYLQPDCDCWE